MGILIEGVWHDQWYDTKSHDGAFVRSAAAFHNWITADGSAGPTGEGGFAAEPDRYHLYISPACPWSHRTIIMRRLKGLEQIIPMHCVSPYMLEHGWSFSGEFNSDNSEPNGCHHLHQLYTLAMPNYSGQVTVPVLWDSKRNTIVTNESANIMRIFNSAFDEITGNRDDYYPQPLRATIDELNTLIYNSLNDGVYRCGFATTQAAYESAFEELFATLDQLETDLSQQRYLIGDQITEADWRLFVTLVRFNCVYHGHFKCNLHRTDDYHNLSNYLRDLYQRPGIADTVNFTHIKQHYYYSYAQINPTRIVPKGPELKLDAPHDRNRF